MTQPEIPMAAIMTTRASSKLNCFISVYLPFSQGFFQIFEGACFMPMTKTSQSSLASGGLRSNSVESCTLATANHHSATTSHTLLRRLSPKCRPVVAVDFIF